MLEIRDKPRIVIGDYNTQQLTKNTDKKSRKTED